jgi:hypothetical protein
MYSQSHVKRASNQALRSVTEVSAWPTNHCSWAGASINSIQGLRSERPSPAYAISGDTAKARTAYQDFLTLWKDADPDIPILKQAKAEYAKLQ